jgi:hypothetical protein
MSDKKTTGIDWEKEEKRAMVWLAQIICAHEDTQDAKRYGLLIQRLLAELGERRTLATRPEVDVGEVTRYCIHHEKYKPSVNIEIARQEDGSTLWKIVRATNIVLNKSGRWEFEPMPSGRDKSFIERTRWATPQEAKAAWDSLTNTEEGQ